MLRPDLPNLVAVALGGGLGSCARFLAQAWLARPWGTLGVNLAGCLVMGALLGLDLGDRTKAFLAVGVLGGFTTFSGLAADVWWGVEQGARASVVLYLLASLLGGALAFAAGLGLGRAFGA